MILLGACGHRQEQRNVQRSFYYWKTVFALSAKEQQTLTGLSVQKLYVKFFDVEWNAAKATAEPVAKSIFNQQPPAHLFITPVIFITQEPLRYLKVQGLDSLAKNMAALLASITSNNSLQLTSEVQLDCDWTATTRNNYFHLLNRLKQEPFFRGKIVSATVRLHQLKFVSQNGVPPVSKGLLMCYNMGNLRHPQTANSILEEEELKKYISHLAAYPLPLDIALPIFDWWVLFDGTQYKGLLREFDPGAGWQEKQRVVFESDTVVNGVSFKAGQWLRHETSSEATIKNCATLLSARMKQSQLTVILYHLSEANLAKYNQHALQSFFDSFY